MKQLMLILSLMILVLPIIHAAAFTDYNTQGMLLSAVYIPEVVTQPLNTTRDNKTNVIIETATATDIMSDDWYTTDGSISFWKARFNDARVLVGPYFYEYTNDWLQHLLGINSRWPWTPPILPSFIKIDCQSDGVYECNNVFLGNQINSSITHWWSGGETRYPPYSDNTAKCYCTYNYIPTAKHGFVANITIANQIQKNPFYFNGPLPDFISKKLSTNYSVAYYLKNEPNEAFRSCGVGTETYGSNGGCLYTFKIEVLSDGIGDITATISNSTVSAPEQRAQEALDKGMEPEKVKQMEQALKEAANDESIFKAVTLFVEMIFSFLLLMYYIISLSMIGLVFGVIIPGIFRRIMTIFYRATRLK